MKTVLFTALVSASVVVTNAQNAPSALLEYIYAPPVGWMTRTVGADAILLSAPTSAAGENCFIGMSRLLPSAGELSVDAALAWTRSFAGFEVRSTMTFPEAPHLIRGVSSQGWEYLIIRRGMARVGSAADPLREQQLYGFVMVARLGNQVATLWGGSADPLVSACFGKSLGNVWPRFFSTLRFRSFRSAETNPLARGVVGSWESYGSSIGGAALVQYVFTAGGRYQESGVLQRYSNDRPISSNQSAGDGTYFIRGGEITLVPDQGPRDVRSIRLESVSVDGGASWVETLSLFKANPVQSSAFCGPFPCGPEDTDLQLRRRLRP